MIQKSLFGLVFAAATALSTFTSAQAQTIELKLGHTGAPNHHYQTISEEFAKQVAQRTNGAIKIIIFPSDQLGNQLESVEGVMIGTHDMVLASDTVLSNWIPDMGILNLPFLFKTLDEYRAIVDGPVGAALSKQAEKKGIVIIGWWENGMRHVTNSKRPIKTPKDLAGLTIRVPEGQIFVDTFKTLGAGPVVMSFGELYSALQLRTVDGQENPPAHIITQNFNEVQAYVSRTGHIHMGSPLIINKARLEKIPEVHRKVLLELGHQFGARHSALVTKLEEQQWAEIKRRGMAINDVDKTPFRTAVQPVYDKASKQLNATLIKQIETQLAKR